MGVEEVIRVSFTEAKNYQANWKEYEAEDGTGRTPDPATKGSTPGAAR